MVIAMWRCMNRLMRLVACAALVSSSALASPKRELQAKPVALPTAEQLIAKYVQAVGGRAAMEKVRSRVTKGTMDPGGGKVVSLELS